MSSEVATITPNGLSREKIELIKQTVAKGSTDLELQLFFHACQRTGLDPLMKQIYAIKRWNQADGRNVMTFQTGIDGYRLIADRTGQYAGSDEPQYTLGPDGFPDVASVTVTKLVGSLPCKFTASVRWAEYVQKTKEGNPTSMWVKMPFLMLGKCAESLALRKAFPAELSGLYTHEEMQQSDTEIEPVKVMKANPAIIGPETRQEDGVKVAEMPLMTQQVHDAPAPIAAFIWQVGKHKSESIATIPSDYLEWFAKDGKRADHVEEANLELDRRRGQGGLL